ncbi:MAG: flavodoxin domain-containing protein [Chloroflexi bacterium]|nr:flavodoxin domain-containing protein [Chloroflexota bacterium]
MRALVVYESMFGNTRAIAEAIADGLRAAGAVDLVEVGVAPSTIPPDVDLLVVGGPTHAHGMTKPESRADSARRAGDRLVSRGVGMREWIGLLSGGSSRVAAAAFDTRIKGPGLLWGSAAKPADRELRALGLRVVARPESFLVEGPTGPLFDRLVDGEVERARAWGRGLAGAVAGAAGRR